MNETKPIILPPPEQIRQRIADCEKELKALRRMLRLSTATVNAESARRNRQTSRNNEIAGSAGQGDA